MASSSLGGVKKSLGRVDRVTALEKSRVPFDERLREACEILRVSIEDLGSAGAQSLDALNLSYDPVAEWALRWLLKQFEVESLTKTIGNSQEIAVLSSPAWYLLHHLIACHPDNLAGDRLKSHGLVQYLLRITTWLKDDETVADNVKERILYAISLLVETIRTKAQRCEDDAYPSFPAEKLKSTIRTTPENAAKILANVLTYTVAMKRRESYDYHLYYQVVKPFLWLWSCAFGVLAIQNEDDALLDDEDADTAFATHCLGPALSLLADLTKFATHSAVSELDKLIKVHVVAPARKLYLKQESPNDLDLEELLEVLSRYLGPLHEVAASHDGKCQHSVTYFFSLAIAAYGMETSRLKRKEHQWLTTIFAIVLHGLGLQSVREHGADGQTIETLKQLLEISRTHEIPLSNGLLVNCVHASGLYSEESAYRVAEAIDWRLLGLCIGIDSSFAALGKTGAEDYMGHIFKHLNSVVYDKIKVAEPRSVTAMQKDISKIMPQSNGCYEAACRYVVIPLIEVHTRRRSLPQLVRCWLAQLEISLESLQNRTGPRDIYQIIWDDERILSQFGVSIQTLNDEQIGELFKMTCNSFEITQASSPEESQLIAAAIVACALLMGISRDSCVQVLSPRAESMYTKIRSLCIQTNLSPRADQCLWRLCSLLMQLWPEMCLRLENTDESKNSENLEASMSLPQSAVDTISMLPNVKHRSSKGIEYQQLYCAFHYLQSYAEARSTYDTHSVATWDKAMAMLLAALSRHFIAEESLMNGKEENLPTNTWCNGEIWRGSIDTILTIPTALLACCASIISRPSCLRLLTTATVGHFFEAVRAICIHDLRDCGQRHSTDQIISFAGMWIQILRMPILLEEPKIADALHRTLINALCHVCDAIIAARKDYERTKLVGAKDWDPPKPIVVSMSSAVDSVHRIGVRMFSSGQRVTIENAVFGAMWHSPSEALYMVPCSELLSTLLDYPKKGMTLMKQPLKESLCISEVFSHSTVEATVIVKSILNKISRYVIETDKRSSQAIVLKPILDITNIEKVGITALEWACCWLKAMKETKEFEDTSCRIFKAILEKLSDITSNETSAEAGIDRLLDLLTSMEAFIRSRPPGFKVSIPHNTINKSYEPLEFMGILHQRLNANSLSLKLGDETLVGYKGPEIACKLFVLQAWMSGSLAETGVLVRAIKSSNFDSISMASVLLVYHSFRCLTPESRSAFLTELTASEKCFESKSELYLVRKIIGTSYNKKDCSAEFKELLSTVLSNLLLFLRTTRSSHLFQLTINSINALIRKNSWVVEQWHVDDIPTEVVIVTSREGSKLPVSDPEPIYCGLCIMFATVLSVHRIRLYGRHHLLVMALQGLLQCLFIPYSNVRGFLAQPPWMDATSHPPTATMASELSRIMSTICDPSANAVKRSKNREYNDLNDPVKKAKSEVGKHLQYVLEQFCVLQTEGRLEPDVREALLPGLYSMMDVTTHGIRGAINARLDKQSRPVFQSLREEWERNRSKQ